MVYPITDANIEYGRLVRALGCGVSRKDERGSTLPDGKYMVVSDSGNAHYVSVRPDLSCDCRDWIMKGVVEEGWEEGLLCKHVIAALYAGEKNEKISEFIRQEGF